MWVNVYSATVRGGCFYTPVMLFSLIGFISSTRIIKRFSLPSSVILFFLFHHFKAGRNGGTEQDFPIALWLQFISHIGNSPGIFLVYLGKKGIIVKSVFYRNHTVLYILNQFQWWQLKHYILDPYRTTKAYYWATFLKTSVSGEDKNLLLIDRDFYGKMVFDNRNEYRLSMMKENTFDDKNNKEGVVQDENGNNFYRLSRGQEYA